MNIRASYGMTVKLKNDQNGEEKVFYLVPAPEENWHEQKISMYHPIGKEIFSKEIGNKVEIPAEDGKSAQYEILEIEPT